jgi:hypothetical protein
LNPYALRHKILSLARLPVPPLPRNWKIISVRKVCVNKGSVDVNHLHMGGIWYKNPTISLQYNLRIRYQEEIELSRIINPDSAGKERSHLSKAVVLAVREMARQSEPGIGSLDLAAFIVLALERIAGTIDVSVAAWEKRGYWVKADKFRMEWLWAGQFARKLRDGLRKEDWSDIALAAAQVAQKLNKVSVAPGNRLGKPWIGAWDVLKNK